MKTFWHPFLPSLFFRYKIYHLFGVKLLKYLMVHIGNIFTTTVLFRKFTLVSSVEPINEIYFAPEQETDFGGFEKLFYIFLLFDKIRPHHNSRMKCVDVRAQDLVKLFVQIVLKNEMHISADIKLI